MKKIYLFFILLRSRQLKIACQISNFIEIILIVFRFYDLHYLYLLSFTAYLIHFKMENLIFLNFSFSFLTAQQMDVLKTENQRLRDENAALIRVISKLSK